MRLLHLKNLFLSSLLFAALSACSPLRGYKHTGTVDPKATGIVPIVNPQHSTHYKAEIDVIGKHYSGLIVVKKTDDSTSHLTFITEVGMKIFDFRINGNNFKLDYIFEPLNKPRIKKILEADMKLILLNSLLNKPSAQYKKEGSKAFKQQKGLRYYYLAGSDYTIDRVIVKGILFRKNLLTYGYEQDIAKQIYLKHSGLSRLKIRLNKIEKIKE